ncbi:MAG TPA: phosphatase [Acidimicrobiia bacterium]|nr:phosphatase [Acidimicrobiia bacterium]
MTRRPASRRPPKLDAPSPSPTPHRVEGLKRKPTARQRLLRAHVSGKARLSRSELLATIRAVLRGDRSALLELAPFEGVTLDDAFATVARVWGPDLGSPELEAAISIDPTRTIAQAQVAFARVADVARRGGRLAFATTRPASLLPLYTALARVSSDAGGQILADEETGLVLLDDRSNRRIRWFDGVAMVVDGDALPGGAGFGVTAELAFRLPPPDLVVADRAIAGGFVRAGIETVAAAGLEAVALGLAADRGLPVTVIPLHESQAPTGYEPLLAVAREAFKSNG